MCLLTQQPELLIFSAALKDNTDEKVAPVSATDHPPPPTRPHVLKQTGIFSSSEGNEGWTSSTVHCGHICPEQDRLWPSNTESSPELCQNDCTEQENRLTRMQLSREHSQSQSCRYSQSDLMVTHWVRGQHSPSTVPSSSPTRVFLDV